MTSIYDRTAERAAKTIAKKGATVVFNPQTATPVTGSALQIEDDPATMAALQLTTSNPVTLLVAASGLGIVPAAGMQFDWAGTRYVAKSVEALAPDGTPILFTVIGAGF